MLDVSSVARVKGAKHWTAEINQLYHPTGKLGQDLFDLVYSGDNINTTKFTPILLKEWFYLVKSGGYLIIDYLPNDICDFQKLEENLLWLWRGKYEIIYHGLVEEKDIKNLTPKSLESFLEERKNFYKTNLDPVSLLPVQTPTVEKPNLASSLIRLVCQKTSATLASGDDINKWTFGIITDGKRRDWMEEIIASIRNQQIPQYEIIVCGTYYDRNEKDFVYLPFNQRRDKKWITRQKNLICQAAKYENVCILHNRLVLEDKWFKGMQKWGNCFELISVKQIQKSTGLLGNHWELTFFLLYKKMSRYFDKIILQFSATLDPRDWFESIIMYGQSIICKKSVYLNHRQNEALYWDWTEDHAFSFDLINSGYIMRYNPLSLMINLDNKYWFNNVSVVYSPYPEEPRYVGPLIKIVYRRLVMTFFNFFKGYKYRIIS